MVAAIPGTTQSRLSKARKITAVKAVGYFAKPEARDGSKTAQILDTPRRRYCQGADESYRLAGAFGTRIPVGNRREEDGIDGDIH